MAGKPLLAAWVLRAGLVMIFGWVCGGPAWAQAPAGAAPPAGSAQPAAPATAAAANPLFTQWCARCHNINGLNAVCPDLSTIGSRRDEDYIRQSIVDPNAYIVPGYPKDVMPRFSLLLKQEEIEALVKYLLTLQGQTADPNRVGKKVQW